MRGSQEVVVTGQGVAIGTHHCDDRLGKIVILRKKKTKKNAIGENQTLNPLARR